jgi:hypothetical protein
VITRIVYSAKDSELLQSFLSYPLSIANIQAMNKQSHTQQPPEKSKHTQLQTQNLQYEQMNKSIPLIEQENRVAGSPNLWRQAVIMATGYEGPISHYDNFDRNDVIKGGLNKGSFLLFVCFFSLLMPYWPVYI